jgi:hypothetical protein
MKAQLRCILFTGNIKHHIQFREKRFVFTKNFPEPSFYFVAKNSISGFFAYYKTSPGL